MKFITSFGYASKSEKSQPLEYKSIKVISESEQKRESEKESHPLKKALKMIAPIQIVSKKAELKSIHPEREEKIVKAIEHLEPSLEAAKGDLKKKIRNTRVKLTLENPQASTPFCILIVSYLLMIY